MVSIVYLIIMGVIILGLIIIVILQNSLINGSIELYIITREILMNGSKKDIDDLKKSYEKNEMI